MNTVSANQIGNESQAQLSSNWLVLYAALLAGFGLFVWVFFQSWFVGSALLPLQKITAIITSKLIPLVGLEAAQEGIILRHAEGFAYQISHGCVGLVPIGFLLIALLAYPATGPQKIWGMLAGAILLVMLNFVRLVHLFYIGVTDFESFHFAHSIGWHAATVIAILGIWYVWTGWVRTAD